MGELNINRYTTCDNLKINFCPESHPVDDDIQELLNEMISEYSINNMPINVDFRKLVSWLKAGDQLTHQIHPYPAKLLPHIIYFFLKAHSNLKHKIVLDPFCGSGTVALEASIQVFFLGSRCKSFCLINSKSKNNAILYKALNRDSRKYFN